MSRTDKDAPYRIRKARGELHPTGWWKAPAPGWFVTSYFRRPERARVRDTCRRAVLEHRGTGEVEVIPPVDQHRHAARRDWW